MSDRSEVARGVNILVKDSGGASSLSSLLILDESMSRLQRVLGLNQYPNVFEHFDIVAGTGTGAFIVCMVGRLRVPVEQAIPYYQRLSEVFPKKRPIAGDLGRFRMRKLQEIIKGIVREVTGDENTKMVDTRPDASECRTMVFAMSQHNLNATRPCVFRSYEVVANRMADCAIWEAACASMAHPEAFKSIDIQDGPLCQTFVGGALGCSNPIEHVLAEAKSLFPDRHVSSITSIGAGHTHTIQISQPSLLGNILPTNALIAMKDIAIDCETAAQRMAVRFQHAPDVYFRFSVEQGMQRMEMNDWERLSEVHAHTRAYMRLAETNTRLERATKAIGEGKKTIRMAHIGQATHVRQCPSPTPMFTRREDKIAQVTACISRDDAKRCVFVIHGMGGAGKTQIALKAIEQTHPMWTDVVYVDAKSRETTIGALEEFATAKGIGSTHQDTITWLGSKRERWLLVFDNADDPSLGISSFMPRGDHGSILITTRLADMALLARGPRSACNVSSMEPAEALELLLKTTRIAPESITSDEREEGLKLVQDFGHLALAVVHAGAYIWRSHLSMRKYRAMFTQQRQVTLDRYSELQVKVDDYEKSVYTTWRMSYDCLGDHAKQLMWLMAFMHNNKLTGGTFRRAALNMQSYQPVIPAAEEDREIQTHVKLLLQSYIDSTGSWDSGAFLSDITELTSYSLVNYDDANDAYNVHVLVHDWVGTVIPGPRVAAVKRTMFLLAVSIGVDDSADELAYQRALELHVNSVLGHDVQPGANDAAGFARVYERTGRWGRKEVLDLIVVAARKEALGSEDLDTLASMSWLASTYSNQGRSNEAEALEAEVLDARKRLLGDEHPDTLTSMNNLASTYSYQGRHEEAETLYLRVVQLREKILGHSHPRTVSAMRKLASSYRHLGLSRQHEYEMLSAKVQEIKGAS
ncbi:hypothetical protein FS749_001177 [Ceratobasidium sp. UAMH 11750]|nr:hypothetical protein FS749_001177 [Ceratobasidium sp. UAMH 11750]